MKQRLFLSPLSCKPSKVHNKSSHHIEELDLKILQVSLGPSRVIQSSLHHMVLVITYVFGFLQKPAPYLGIGAGCLFIYKVLEPKPKCNTTSVFLP